MTDDPYQYEDLLFGGRRLPAFMYGRIIAIELLLEYLLARMPRDEFEQIIAQMEQLQQTLVERRLPTVALSFGQEVTEARAAAPRHRSDGASGDIEQRLSILTAAVETIHGPIGKEYDPASSGRPDD